MWRASRFESPRIAELCRSPANFRLSDALHIRGYISTIDIPNDVEPPPGALLTVLAFPRSMSWATGQHPLRRGQVTSQAGGGGPVGSTLATRRELFGTFNR